MSIINIPHYKDYKNKLLQENAWKFYNQSLFYIRIIIWGFFCFSTSRVKYSVQLGVREKEVIMKKGLYIKKIIPALVILSLILNCRYTEPEQPTQEELILSFINVPDGNLSVEEGTVITLQWQATGCINNIYYSYWVIDITDTVNPDTLAEELYYTATTAKVSPEDGHTYSVVVKATGDEDISSTISTQFTVTVFVFPNLPTVEITKPAAGWKYAVGSNILFEWATTDRKNETVESSFKIYDGKWSVFEVRNNVGMINIEEGDHTFYIQVRNESGCENGTSVNFTVKKPNILVFNEVTTPAGDYKRDKEHFDLIQTLDFRNFYGSIKPLVGA